MGPYWNEKGTKGKVLATSRHIKNITVVLSVTVADQPRILCSLSPRGQGMLENLCRLDMVKPVRKLTGFCVG